MSHAVLTWSIFGVGILAFSFFLLVVGLWKRHQWLIETKGKVKVMILGETIRPEILILPLEPGGIEVKAPKGHTVGSYIISKEAQFDTDYPEKPFAGLYFLQVPIKTLIYGVDNPEPLSPYQHKEVGTASQIFASGDSTFYFAARQAKQELERERVKLEKGKLNATYLYIALVLLIAIGAGNIFMSNSHTSILQAIAQAVGAN